MKDARIRADGTAIGRGRETDKDLDGLVELPGEDVLGTSSGRVPTTSDLHITVSIITTGFVRTGSDILSLSVMSLKMKK